MTLLEIFKFAFKPSISQFKVALWSNSDLVISFLFISKQKIRNTKVALSTQSFKQLLKYGAQFLS